jgi:hypothetical protein
MPVSTSVVCLEAHGTRTRHRCMLDRVRLTFSLSSLLKQLYLRERKCQTMHLNPPRGPPRTMKVRLRTEKVTLLYVMTLVIVQHQVNEMWSEYLENVDDYDKRLTEGWKDDANGVLVFVSSIRLLVRAPITVTIWEPDRSFLRNCRILHHRKLQTLIARSW